MRTPSDCQILLTMSACMLAVVTAVCWLVNVGVTAEDED